MSETSDSASPGLAETKKAVLLRFWQIALRLHGHPADNYEPSKLHALRLTQELHRVASEGEAIRCMLEDREGTLSLLCATHLKACNLGYALSLADVEHAKTADKKLDQGTWQQEGMYWFCRESLRDCIVPFGTDVS